MHTSAILATHIYGTPCDVEGLRDVAEQNGLRLFFDAAHAFGSMHGGTKVGGFGDAEVFSLSPTKVVIAAEGGVIATNDDLLAERCRIGRDYGNPGDYDCRVRRSERPDVGAPRRDRSVVARGPRRATGRAEPPGGRVHGGARGVPGIRIPEVPAGDRSTYKDYTVLIDPDGFGLGRGDRWSSSSGGKGSRPAATTRRPSTRCGRIGCPDTGRTRSR